MNRRFTVTASTAAHIPTPASMQCDVFGPQEAAQAFLRRELPDYTLIVPTHPEFGTYLWRYEAFDNAAQWGCVIWVREHH